MINKTPLILIVDDNPQNVQFLGNLLRGKGYQLGIAFNGVEALKFLDESLPDLILLDIMMPEMDGLEFCKKLKSNKNLSHIPVIFLTAKSEPEDIVKGFEAGGVDYVTKPFINAELLARVKTHLEISYLKNLIPICASCRKVRDDKGLWNQIEHYIEKHTNTLFSHGICDECAEELYKNEKWYQKMKDDKQ